MSQPPHPSLSLQALCLLQVRSVTSSFRLTPVRGSLAAHMTTLSDNGRLCAAITIAVAEDFRDGALDGLMLHWACAPRQGGAWQTIPGGWRTDPDNSRDAGTDPWCRQRCPSASLRVCCVRTIHRFHSNLLPSADMQV